MRMKKLLAISILVSCIFLFFGGIGESQQLEIKTGTVIGHGQGPFGSKKWIEIKDDAGSTYNFRVGRATSFQPKFPKTGDRVEVHYREVKGTWVGYKVIILK